MKLDGCRSLLPFANQTPHALGKVVFEPSIFNPPQLFVMGTQFFYTGLGFLSQGCLWLGESSDQILALPEEETEPDRDI